MENLPKNVINKIFLFLEHPTAKIIKGETIFKFMALRLGEIDSIRWGSPHICGIDDSWNEEDYREMIGGCILPITWGLVDSYPENVRKTPTVEDTTA